MIYNPHLLFSQPTENQQISSFKIKSNECCWKSLTKYTSSCTTMYKFTITQIRQIYSELYILCIAFCACIHPHILWQYEEKAMNSVYSGVDPYGQGDMSPNIYEGGTSCMVMSPNIIEVMSFRMSTRVTATAF